MQNEAVRFAIVFRIYCFEKCSCMHVFSNIFCKKYMQYMPYISGIYMCKIAVMNGI